MKRFACALALSFVTLAGCAVQTADVERTSSEREALATAVGDDVWPVLAAAPTGVPDRASVCSTNESQAKAAWRAWLTKTGKTQGGWVHTAKGQSCTACDLENANLADYGDVEFDIQDSYLGGTLMQSWGGGTKYVLKNVYAYGSEVDEGIILEAQNTDMRCGWIRKGVKIQNSKGLDVSGTSSDLLAIASSSDVRISGLDVGTHAEGVVLTDIDTARVQTTLPVRIGGTMKGTWTFDRANFDLRVLELVTFDGATLSLTDAKGIISLKNGPMTFKGGAVTGANGPNGDVIIRDFDGGKLRVIGGASWPVGRTGLVSEARLASVDFSGAKLVNPSGETWPLANADLSHLRLTNGALPDGADLTSATLDDAHFEGVDFSKVTLSKAVGSTTVAANLSGAHLQRASFKEQPIEGVKFVRADLRGANLDTAKGAADFSSATAGTLPPHTDGNDTNSPIATSFNSAKLASSTFAGAQIQGAKLTYAELADVTFDAATDVTGADFSSAWFVRFAKDGSLIANGSFGKIQHMHGVVLDHADLRGVSLAGVDLATTVDGKRASLDHTFLCGADLTRAKLGGANLLDAYADVTGSVKFPEGTGACAPAIRTGVDTTNSGGTSTDCPTGGRGAGAGGACTDAQWKVTGDAPSCTGNNDRMDGAPCATDCDCQSSHCGANKKCG